MPRTSKPALRRARELRQAMPRAEALLWSRLRRRQTGYHFRRQVPIGPFFADFACLSERLIVEVDGDGHNYQRNPQRDGWFEENGFRTLRVFNVDVYKRLDEVVGRITMELNEPGAVTQDL